MSGPCTEPSVDCSRSTRRCRSRRSPQLQATALAVRSASVDGPVEGEARGVERVDADRQERPATPARARESTRRRDAMRGRARRSALGPRIRARLLAGRREPHDPTATGRWARSRARSRDGQAPAARRQPAFRRRRCDRRARRRVPGRRDSPAGCTRSRSRCRSSPGRRDRRTPRRRTSRRERAPCRRRGRTRQPPQRRAPGTKAHEGAPRHQRQRLPHACRSGLFAGRLAATSRGAWSKR